jgi:8-oxo-dGTP pyrophosphatase MutT (NUDIX family)
MSRAYNYCNNCGENGHQFHHCKKPITSLGIIAFRNTAEGKRQFLLIRRKDSLGYVDFMRGKYPITNRAYLENIISEMTVEERDRIRNLGFDRLWTDLWGDNIGIQYRGEEKISRDKMESLRAGVRAGEDEYNLIGLLDAATTRWTETEWGFPKGRRNYQEKELACALRECEEETGYRKSDFRIVQNLVPLQETFTGSNFKSYKHCYYLAEHCPDEEPGSPVGFQQSEVSAVRWMSLEQATSAIRPYNKEKIEVLTRANKILDEYRIYC